MEQISDFLGRVKTQLDRCELAYNAYIKSGKKFLYAKILREANDAVRDLLIKKAHLLPIEHTGNALALIHHIDVWSTIWDDSAACNRPSLMSTFVFENGVTFPREEVAGLMRYYESHFIQK